MESESIKVTFEKEFEEKVSEWKFEEALQILKLPETAFSIKNDIWNLINKVCLIIKSQEVSGDHFDFNSCQKLLMHLAEQGNPKEVLIALMEEADAFQHHIYFCLLLEPLKVTLMRVPGKRAQNLEWVLSTLNAHFLTLDLPQDQEEQLVVDPDPVGVVDPDPVRVVDPDTVEVVDPDPLIVDLNFILPHYLEFLTAFIDEVSCEIILKEKNNEQVSHQRHILQRYLLMLLHRPFLYHDLQTKSTIRTLCEQSVKNLSRTCRNVFSLFRHDIKIQTTDTEDELVPSLAFSNLAYLIFVEHLFIDIQPLVYSHMYTFKRHLEHIILLLTEVENLVIFKGLHLANTLLYKLNSLEVDSKYGELDAFTEFPKLLLKIAIFCQVETHRSFAIKIFQNYMEKLDWRNRYHIIFFIMCTIKHSGAEGLVINMYKTYLHMCLENTSLQNKGQLYFLSETAFFLKKVFSLKDGVETDLLEHSDRIISALNLLRYLLLRDKQESNQTGLWDQLDFISVNFVKPLMSGLNMSKAHYNQVILDAGKGEVNNIAVSVNNNALSNVAPQFDREVYMKALLTFDLMESILCRVRELYVI